ncbi:MAG: hypothetical protein GF331_03830 [Chitinivibrionales bacterium]|nr:hypothetical protein [Chitinivibrionales bacterium]
MVAGTCHSGEAGDMRSKLAVWCLVVAMLSAQSVLGVDIVVNGADENQVIDGFGTSVMNWMSAVYGNAQLRTDYARDLGCSVVRGELHPAAITKDACMDRNPTQFGTDIDANIALMDFVNQSRVSITGGFMEAVYEQRLDEMKVMLSIWTPPDWMKANTNFGDPGCQSYGGHLIRTDANRTNFARYVAAWIKGFSQTYNIPVYCLSVQNELDWAHSPSSWTTSCQYFSTVYPGGDTRTNNGPAVGVNDYNPAVQYVHDELEANNLQIKFFGPEKSHIFRGIYDLSFQMFYIMDMADDGTMAIMDGFCHHGYAHTPTNRGIISSYWDGHSDAGNPSLNWDGIKTYGKPSWQTEAATHPITWQGAVDLATTIQDELVAGNLSAYLNWAYSSSSSDDTHSLIVNTNQRTDKYYAFKHFSRYIRPGAIRLGCSPDVPDGLSVSAYRHDANGTLTIVMVNRGNAQTANITLPATPTGIPLLNVYTSRAGDLWAQSTATVSGSAVSVSVPSSAIVTLYGEGASSADKPRHGAAAPSGHTARPHSFVTLSPGERGDGVVVTARSHGTEAAVFDLRGRAVRRAAAFSDRTVGASAVSGR